MNVSWFTGKLLSLIRSNKQPTKRVIKRRVGGMQPLVSMPSKLVMGAQTMVFRRWRNEVHLLAWKIFHFCLRLKWITINVLTMTPYLGTFSWMSYFLYTSFCDNKPCLIHHVILDPLILCLFLLVVQHRKWRTIYCLSPFPFHTQSFYISEEYWNIHAFDVNGSPQEDLIHDKSKLCYYHQIIRRAGTCVRHCIRLENSIKLMWEESWNPTDHNFD